MAGEPERSIKCDIMTCDSEMDTAHRNYALLHYMKSMEARKYVVSNNFIPPWKVSCQGLAISVKCDISTRQTVKKATKLS